MSVRARKEIKALRKGKTEELEYDSKRTVTCESKRMKATVIGSRSGGKRLKIITFINPSMCQTLNAVHYFI